MRQTRTSNFEALRILAILLILFMHVYSQVPKAEMNSSNLFLGQLINAIGNIGVSCFVLISGYFGLKFKARRFVQLILLTTFYALIVYVTNNGFTLQVDILNALLVVPLYKNWFIACYLILILIAPFINDYTENAEKGKIEKLLAIQFLAFSILPTLFNTPFYTILTGGGKCLVYLIFIYMVGRYLRQCYNIRISRKKTLGVFLLMTSIILILNLSISAVLNRRLSIYAMDCSPFILISAISVFYLLKSFTFQSRFINYIASSILAVYLLDGMRIPIDKYLIHLTQYANNPMLALYIVAVVLLTFTTAIFIDKARERMLTGLEDKLINLTITHYELFRLHFNRIISKRIQTKTNRT